MAVIKRTFTAGKMNKDIDERLVPNGEYRDAMNIQVRTTDSGDAGTVQNLQGHAEMGTNHRSKSADLQVLINGYYSGSHTKSIGCVSDERNNKAYFLYASPTGFDASVIHDGIYADDRHTWIDYIIEQDADGSQRAVVVDIFGIVEKYTSAGSPNLHVDTDTLTVSDGSIYRVGMTVQAFTQAGDTLIRKGTKIVSISGNVITLSHTHSAIDVASTCVAMAWTAPRALGFNSNTIITGINIIDDYLFYTTNNSEPRKINIKACKKGTSSNQSQTKLRLNSIVTPGTTYAFSDFENQTLSIPANNGDILEEHLTVIRKAPRTAPTLIMGEAERGGNNSWTTSISTNNLQGNAITTIAEDTILWLSSLASGVHLQAGDKLSLTCLDDTDDSPTTIRVNVENVIGNLIITKVLSVSSDILSSHLNYLVELEQDGNPLFELKFPRFGYRYKYSDGEYSSFSPWSEIAFLPGDYEYNPRKGYNLGMVNNLRSLKISNFLPDQRVRPDDIVAVDILYKSTDSPNVYVAKTIEKEIDPEWNLFDTDSNNEVVITSDMIHRTLPSDQILRSWDNVPRFAKAQEIVGNRLIYGNYTQGYNLSFKPSVNQYISSSSITNMLTPEKSVKSLRSYKIGLVYGDKYGRETPVISVGDRSNVTSVDQTLSTSDSTYVSKIDAKNVNKITVQQEWEDGNNISHQIYNWVDYVKYYIKEPSSEYYNLTMDRWYDASDGNAWISFPSSERNKVDEESYLILKKEHDSDSLVEEEARYKVLAIENEAPDFVKSRLKSLGSSSIWTNELNITANVLNGLMTRTDFSIGDNINTASVGTLKVRARATANEGTDSEQLYFTSWKNVVRLVAAGDVTNQNNTASIASGFAIQNPWGNEADFTTMANLNGSYTDLAAANTALNGTYFFEFADEVIENKPEYDGRFFVKLNKDFVLKDKVMIDLKDGLLFQVDEYYGLSYVDTQSNNNPADNTGYTDSVVEAMPYYNDDWGTELAPDLATNVNARFGTTTYRQQTKSWWIARQDRLFTAPVFIDAAPIIGFQTAQFSATSNGYTLPMLEKTGKWEDENGDPLSPADRGMTRSGTLNNETYDRIYFSISGRYNLNSAGEQVNGSLITDFNIGFIAAFKNAMTSGDTYFRFTQDPNAVIYKVVEGTDEDGLGFSGYANNILNYHNENNGTNFYDTHYNGFDQSQRRSSFYTTFRRLNDENQMLDEGINIEDWDPRGAFPHDSYEVSTVNLNTAIQILTKHDVYNDEVPQRSNAAIFETEPKESVDLDLYYEASNAIPMNLNSRNTIEFAPVNSEVKIKNNSGDTTLTVSAGEKIVVGKVFDGVVKLVNDTTQALYTGGTTYVNGINVGDEISFTHADGAITRSEITGWVDADAMEAGTVKPIPSTSITVNVVEVFGSGTAKFSVAPYTNSELGIEEGQTISGPGLASGYKVFGAASHHSHFSINLNGGSTSVQVGDITIGDNTVFTITASDASGYYSIDKNVYKYKVDLPWSNCYSFGNGVESNRIRDDFNTPTIDNGVKVSTTLDGYREENKTNGLIFSGIYNTNSNVNNLNEFNMSQNITKDLNPAYGSIQALKTRDTDLITFTEDKVLRVLANKDALFNADGNSSLTASDRVLGQAVPYVGDYGISKNPESLAKDQFRMYFTDKQRGAVLRLSRDGLTPISNVGMKTWFRENLPTASNIIGSFDVVNGEYNITLHKNLLNGGDTSSTTVSFNEASKGWVSFKSWLQDCGVSVSGSYFTNKKVVVYKHHQSTDLNGDSINYNILHGEAKDSYINVIFNDLPSSVKNFKSVSYEGSDGKMLLINNATVTSPNGESITGLTLDSYSIVPTIGTDSTSPTTSTTSKGWSFSNITTDLQAGSALYLSKKEGKWFSDISGDFTSTDISSIDEGEFNVQGLGYVDVEPTHSAGSQATYTLTIDGNG